MVYLSDQKILQTLGHYAHGQRVRLVSDTAPFRIRLPGGSSRTSDCVWCCCDPVTGDPVDTDRLELDMFTVHRVVHDNNASSAVSEFTIQPREALPAGKTFTFHLRYVCPHTGVRLPGRDSRYRVTVFYAPA